MKLASPSLPGETNNAYRNRVGRISRYQHLKNQRSDRSLRNREKDDFDEAVKRVTARIQAEMAQRLGRNRRRL